ncbi:hypothetical protein EV182_000331 [Spiromyces aspiralis]|uniref:Uncharacterized protein n=1 Tax=Spiromyces aspiralis TaxID=68401 RepID=A0ACC1HHF3_9FUNG|nr:hypothetical protein EV182_000331 [Spiromyces aspiralis]
MGGTNPNLPGPSRSTSSSSAAASMGFLIPVVLILLAFDRPHGAEPARMPVHDASVTFDGPFARQVGPGAGIRAWRILWKADPAGEMSRRHGSQNPQSSSAEARRQDISTSKTLIAARTPSSANPPPLRTLRASVQALHGV